MNYLSIIEENFTKADYVAYLRGCILQALLEDKPIDLPQFKLYADKLVDILEEPVDEQDYCRPTVIPQIKSFDYTTVDQDEPQVQPKPKFNIGGHQASLQPNKWYHTTDFTEDELSALLPSGTQVEAEAKVLYSNIDTTPPTKTKRAVVKNVVPSAIEEQTFIETTNDSFYKEWFKIVQED